jgi:hypothetical protein
MRRVSSASSGTGRLTAARSAGNGTWLPYTGIEHTVGPARNFDCGRGSRMWIVMPHFYRNWADEYLRRFVLNGIGWTAKLEVPWGGVQTKVPFLAAFAPESIEPKPREKPNPA